MHFECTRNHRVCLRIEGSTAHLTLSQKADGKAKESSLHMQCRKNMRQMVICWLISHRAPFAHLHCGQTRLTKDPTNSSTPFCMHAVPHIPYNSSVSNSMSPHMIIFLYAINGFHAPEGIVNVRNFRMYFNILCSFPQSSKSDETKWGVMMTRKLSARCPCLSSLCPHLKTDLPPHLVCLAASWSWEVIERCCWRAFGFNVNRYYKLRARI